MAQHMLRAALCAAAALFIGAIPASGQNLLTNPGFDTDLSGWQNPSGATHDATAGAASAGSARWEATVESNSDEDQITIVFQCFAGVVPGATYEFGGSIMITEAPTDGSALVIAVFRDDATCEGDVVGGWIAPPVTDVTSGFEAVSATVVAPAGSGSVAVGVLAGIEAAGPGPLAGFVQAPVPGDYLVHVDDMFLIEQGAVPTAGALWLVALGLFLAGAAAIALRRRAA